MADDVEVEQPESSAEAALAMFNEPAEPDAATPEIDAAVGEGHAEPDAAQSDQPTEPQALSDEQIAADPRYQALSEFQDSVQPVMEKFGVPDASELTAQLSDSQVLYDIMSGKGTPSQLLEVMAQASHWTTEQRKGIAQDLIGWLTKNNYLKGDAASKTGDPKFTDPLSKDVADLKKTLADRDAAAEQQRVQTHQLEVFKTVESKIADLCKAQKLSDPADVNYYLNQVAALVGGNKAIIGRIEKGNFVDIQKLFSQVHNAEVQRLTRHTAAQTRTQANKAKNPRIPAGGAPPAPAAQAKRNLGDRDSRIAAATAQFNES